MPKRNKEVTKVVALVKIGEKCSALKLSVRTLSIASISGKHWLTLIIPPIFLSQK